MAMSMVLTGITIIRIQQRTQRSPRNAGFFVCAAPPLAGPGLPQLQLQIFWRLNAFSHALSVRNWVFEA